MADGVQVIAVSDNLTKASGLVMVESVACVGFIRGQVCEVASGEIGAK